MATTTDDRQSTFEALSSPIRREILWMVWDRELPAGTIAAAFDVSAPTISSHLAILRRAGLVEVRVDANFRRYRAVRPAVAAIAPLLASADSRWDSRWEVADDIPEHAHADSRHRHVVEVAVEIALDVAEAFDVFVDERRYSAFMGVPVQIRDGQFSCTMEWGTQIRGRYDVVAAPRLIALRWDLADDEVPVPGAELVGYMRFDPTPTGTAVTVHQHVDDETQADFMRVAWGLVLGRFLEYHSSAAATGPRRARPKHRGTTGRRP